MRLLGRSDSVDFGYMFNSMSSLKRIDMPQLQSIGVANTYGVIYSLFANCTSLEEVEFPELEYVGR